MDVEASSDTGAWGDEAFGGLNDEGKVVLNMICTRGIGCSFYQASGLAHLRVSTEKVTRSVRTSKILPPNRYLTSVIPSWFVSQRDD